METSTTTTNFAFFKNWNGKLAITIFVFFIFSLSTFALHDRLLVKDDFQRANNDNIGTTSTGGFSWYETEGAASHNAISSNVALIRYSSSLCPKPGISLSDFVIKDAEIIVDNCYISIYRQQYTAVNYRAPTYQAATDVNSANAYHVRFYLKWDNQGDDLELYYGTTKLSGINLSDSDRPNCPVKLIVRFDGNFHSTIAEWLADGETHRVCLDYKETIADRTGNGYIGLGGFYNYSVWDNLQINEMEMVVGWYNALASTSQTPVICSNTEANTLLGSYYLNDDNTLTGLDQLWESGKRAIVMINWDWVKVSNGNINTEMITNFINKFNSHPAVTGWYIAEELHWDANFNKTNTQAAYSLIKSLSKKTVFVCFTGSVVQVFPGTTNYVMDQYTDCFDVFLFDRYSAKTVQPVPGAASKPEFCHLEDTDPLVNSPSQGVPPSGYKSLVDKCGDRWMSYFNAPWYSISQACGRDMIDLRLPSLKESAFQNFYPLMKNATGFIFYRYMAAVTAVQNVNDPYPGTATDWIQNDVYNKVAGVLRTIGRAVKNGEIVDAVDDANSDVSTKIFKEPSLNPSGNDKYYLVSVNNEATSNSCSYVVSFTNAPSFTNAKLVFSSNSSASANITVSSNEFNINLNQYEVYVWELEY